MYRAGWRFPLNRRRCKALETLKFGPRDYRKEGEETLLLSDARPVSQEAFGDAVIVGAKLWNRNKQPVSMSSVVACVEQQTLPTQGFYGIAHGPDRDEALKFFVDMRKTSPDIPPIEFLVDAWGRFNADYVDSIYEGIRRVFHFLGKTSTRPELRKVALSPTSEIRTFWRELSTWGIKSSKGVRRSIPLPELQGESKRQESKASSGRYLARRRRDRNRAAVAGITSDAEMETFPSAITGNLIPSKRGRRRASGNSNNSLNLGARKVI